MRKIWLLFSQGVTVALAALFVVSTLKPAWLPASMRPAAPAAATTTVVPMAPTVQSVTIGGTRAVTSYSEAAKRAAPAVVSITASRASARSGRGEDPMFRFFFGNRGQPPEQDRQVGVGSGVIVSPAGYLITNNHVIEGADDIEVALGDGRTARATVVGTDPESDVAVLKIDLKELPVVNFGDVDHVQVGDVVLAIGNPFGVGQTVTSGIVSALGRNQLGINTFENFIQTDAAINPGNSGGALVDAAGNLLGINTAIYSRSGGSLGIGFAIPVTTARQVMESLITEGRVTRGWIGVEPRDLTPEIARTLNLKVERGVLITGVLQNGPASRAGITPGDVVVKIADKPVTSTSQLLNAVAALKPRQTASISVQRGSETVDVPVVIAERPPARPMPRER
ncbi:S1C family serine protease [Piscinibacter koreensis]|uniref:Trypsin-like peptidase domain-containing protein n=1 Tax=Piscinibacter koreensis TaxID=2742824 RepID=A0A7Y6TW41_9BURK|nr:trypsin-like peptidase domain-containing protein [Schlegelella koreensis]NUZ05734.1 trypsin-like peptidase domain-containing protein [Schlegelella koreensis]